MNWEHSVLNRIYKTLDFKVNTAKLNTIKNKSNYIEKVNELIDKFDLREFNLNLSEQGALYLINNNNKHTFYFNYETNHNFILYANFFEIEAKFIKYEDYDYEGIIIENPDKEPSNLFIPGFKYANLFKNYLLKLLLLREKDEAIFISELLRINKYLSMRTFLIGNQVSHYDVILLSILQYWKRRKEMEEYFEQNNLLNLNRWANFLETHLELDYSKIEKLRDNKMKENLGETYKITSNQELVNSVQNNDTFKLKELLLKGENVNSRELDCYKSLAHLACRKGDFEMLKVLIEYGCDLEALDDEYMTPIYEALYSKNLELCEYLIEEAKVDLHHLEIQRRTPFYWAACVGDLNMVNYLLTKPGMDVDINTTSKMGRSPLSKACWNGNLDIVQRLCREKSLIINLPDKNGRYPLHNAVWGEYGGRLGKKVNGVTASDSPEAALYLIQAGHLLEVEDNEGYTPLMIAASTNGIRSLELLLQQGADPNHLNKYGATAVIEATRYGNAEPVKVLLEKAQNMDIEVRDFNGVNANEYAVFFDRDESLIILLDYKEQNNSLFDEDVLKLLLMSIQSNSKRCFALLIDKLNQKEIFCKTKSCYSKYIQFFKNMMEIILNLRNFRMFNIICKEYFHYVEIIFFSDIQLLVKSIILLDSIEKIEKNENNHIANHISTNENSFKVTSPFSNKEESFDDEESLNSHSDDLSKEEVITDFKFNIENLYKMYLSKIYESETISHTFIKTLIYLNSHKRFSGILHSTDINLNNLEIIRDELLITKDNYTYILIDNKRKNHNRNCLDSDWCSILRDLSYHNILTFSIEKADDLFFNSVITLQFSQKLIFESMSDNKNILHIMFRFDNVNKFRKLLDIVESHYPNRIKRLLEMLDEYDLNSLTPLDVIMKNKLFDLVETYTKVLNDVRIKHNINANNNYTFYKIYDYEIIEEESIKVDCGYKQFVEENLEASQSLLKKANEKSITNIETQYLQYVYIASIASEVNNINTKLVEVIQNINESHLVNDFRLSDTNYNYKWVDDEETLKYCAKHLNNFHFIGVDLEYHGSNSDKDGIVCVLQLSSLYESFAIDTLKLRKEISVHLKPIFEDSSIIKVFHGCDNDLVWLITNFGIFTKNIFDTGRAYLVFQKYILNKSFKVSNLPSLNFLTKFFLRMEIDKSYQKSDWRIRPLTTSKTFYIILDMLQYALNDAKSVVYLFVLFIGLFQYLTLGEGNQKFYENLIEKFKENREIIGKVSSNISFDMILIEICMRCNELIKMKLKDSYLKLTINPNNC